MKLIPLGNRLVVKSVQKGEKTESGIILSRAARVKPNEAEIIAIGGDILNTDLQVGDRVFISKYAGTDIELDGTTYTIINMEDILAVIAE